MVSGSNLGKLSGNRSAGAFFRTMPAASTALKVSARPQRRNGRRVILARGPDRTRARIVDAAQNGFATRGLVVSLLRDENMHQARHLKKSRRVQDIHAPVIEIIRKALRRGPSTCIASNS
jgi:hypothetical protein